MDNKDLKFKDLLGMVDTVAPKGKLPTVNQLRNDENEEILIEEKCGDAVISVFKNGLIIYNRDEHETVTTVDRCASPTYSFTASRDEREEGTGVAGCKSRIVRKSDGVILLSSVPEETFHEYPWYVPIVIICEARLDHNQEARAISHEEYSYSDGIFDSNKNLLAPSVEEELRLSGPDFDEHELQHLALESAKPKMTDKQREAIDLYHNHNMTDKQVGKAMKEKCNQQAANRHRRAGYARVIKEYDRIKKSLKE